MSDKQRMIGQGSSALIHIVVVLIAFLLKMPGMDISTADLILHLASTQDLDPELDLPVLAEDEITVDTEYDAGNGPTIVVPVLVPGLLRQLDDDPAGEAALRGAMGGIDRSGVSGEHGEFFGLGARGRRFVFIIDHTGIGSPSPYAYKQSLAMTGTKATQAGYRKLVREWYRKNKPDDFRCPTGFRVAVQELEKSLDQLSENQLYCIVFCGNRVFVQHDGGPKLQRATEANTACTKTWLSEIVPYDSVRTSVDPRPAIRQACQLQPDAIFLMTDGIYGIRPLYGRRIQPDESTDMFFSCLLEQQREWPCPIHVIGLVNNAINRNLDVRDPQALFGLGYSNEIRRMRRIADETAGQCVFLGTFD